MRKGYKDSPLGKIPESWEVLSVNKIGDITSSKRIHKADYTQSGIPFFRGKEITQLAKGEILSEIVYIKTETFNKLKIKFGAPQKNDILITAVGTIGSVYLVKEGEEFYFKDGNLMWIRNVIDTINKRYLMHYFRSDIFQNLINIVSSGSSQKALTIVKFKSLFVPVPKEIEQKKIAEILSTVDDKIELINQQITETQELKKGLMQRLLAKGIGHKKFKDSPLGKIPESWEVVRLAEVAKIERGKFQHRPRNDPKFYGGKYPYVQTGDIAKSNGKITSYFQTLNDLGLSVSRLFPKGTIVITIAANIGDTAIAQFEVAFPDSLIGINVKDGMNNIFLKYYLDSQKSNLNKLSTVSAQKNINLETLKPYKLRKPPLSEQKKIADILSSIDDKLEVLSEKKTHYQELKKGLMQQLLTGKIRVKTSNTLIR